LNSSLSIVIRKKYDLEKIALKKKSGFVSFLIMIDSDFYDCYTKFWPRTKIYLVFGHKLKINKSFGAYYFM